MDVQFALAGKRLEAVPLGSSAGAAPSKRVLAEWPEQCEALTNTMAANVAMLCAVSSARADVSVLPGAPRAPSPLNTPTASPSLGASAAPVATPAALPENVLSPSLDADRDTTTSGPTRLVRVDADFPHGVLEQLLGRTTVYLGRQPSGGSSYAREDVHCTVCALPCTAALAVGPEFRVAAPVVHLRNFTIPGEGSMLDVRVKGAPRWQSETAEIATWVGAIAAGAGLIGSVVQYVREPSRAVGYTGLGVLSLGIVGLILAPRSHVDTSEGLRLDARAAPHGIQLSQGSGVHF